MCGIIGYTGKREALPILLEGLHRLEYRGYDSSGVVIQRGNDFTCEKSAGKISALEQSLAGRNIPGAVGIGHTRWATHGLPTTRNAHPHLSCDGSLAVVHNGIIENYAALRDRLRSLGHRFTSETDTEVIAHLIEEYEKGDPLDAVRRAIAKLRGSYAIAVLFRSYQNIMVAARLNSPLVVGFGKDEHFIASDIAAILPFTRTVTYMGEGEIAVVASENARLYDASLKQKKLTRTLIPWDASHAEKGGLPHYMLKEIREEPKVAEDEIAGRIDRKKEIIDLSDARLGSPRRLNAIRRIVIAACGTAWHAGLYAKYVIEETCAIPVDLNFASELRYGSTPLGKETLLIAISQSGETADTLAAVRMAKAKGATVLAISNVKGSSVPRESDWTIAMRAGLEIGVAATKTYLSQLLCVAMFAIRLGTARGTLPRSRRLELISALSDLPGRIGAILENMSAVKFCAEKYSRNHDFMYIGRGYNLATAYEGALKMKEISYLHAEGYGGGEMKHGPLALVDANLTTVAIAAKGKVYEKMVSNMQEIKARKGKIIGVLTAGDKIASRIVDHTFTIPSIDEFCSPMIAVVPLQLLAYYAAVKLGRDVDQPRNLAKSVTVE